MKIKRTTFTVRGHGAFPLDMLRHDACWPVTGTDVDNLTTPEPGEWLDNREVTLQTDRVVTDERWRSFSWPVIRQKVVS
jgi:hypothetical protein